MSTHRAQGDTLDRIDGRIAWLEGAILVGVLAVMMGLSVVQLGLRKFFDFGFEWADIVVRQGVVWFGFVGGALATHHGRHIAIDAACKYLRPSVAATVRVATSLVSVAVMSAKIYAAWKYLGAEIEGGSTIFGDVPAWPFKAVIPASFVAAAFHFAVAARNDVLVALGRRSPMPDIDVAHPRASSSVVGRNRSTDDGSTKDDAS